MMKNFRFLAVFSQMKISKKNVLVSVNLIGPSDPISNSVASLDILQIPLNTVWSDADFPFVLILILIPVIVLI